MRLKALLTQIYGAETGSAVDRELTALIAAYKGRIPPAHIRGLSQRDAILITYADQVRDEGQRPLQSLGGFCAKHVQGLVSGMHILPFYPWSSDDGFSVIDYEAVAPEYGSWDDIRALGERFRLMFDAVVNHVSAESEWFRGYLRGDSEYRDYFIQVDGDPNLSDVVRPRALPLLTQFEAAGAMSRLWTTFSADQIDLNYHNPRVLLKMLDVLLFYASRGAELIRLDAIAYLWKEPGTPCINLPQTHWIVQLMRAVLDEAAPHVMLITETNVPNLENLSYFGDGTNEAQLVYNFPLPPLVLHALHTGSAKTLSKWAATLELPSDQVTFLNFLASHDGIGLNPVRGILPESEIEGLAARVERGGGFVSMKTNANGTQSPYELNVNYFDALDGDDARLEPRLQVQRFLAAHAILLAFKGLPAIYFHSLFGSRGWPEGVKQTGKFRTINREKLEREALERELADAHSIRAQVFGGMAQMLRARAGEACFSPHASQSVLEAPESVFALRREAGGRGVLCLHNTAASHVGVQLELAGTALSGAHSLRDLISGQDIPAGKSVHVSLEPYQSAWLAA